MNIRWKYLTETSVVSLPHRMKTHKPNEYPWVNTIMNLQSERIYGWTYISFDLHHFFKHHWRCWEWRKIKKLWSSASLRLWVEGDIIIQQCCLPNKYNDYRLLSESLQLEVSPAWTEHHNDNCLAKQILSDGCRIIFNINLWLRHSMKEKPLQ